MRKVFGVKKIFYSNAIFKKIWFFIGNLYEHMTKPTGALMSFCLFPILGFCRVHRLLGLEKPYDKIEVLKDKYKGRRCFVVATGPSLRVEDLELLNDEITISMNHIHYCYSRTKWRPNFFFYGDFAGLKESYEKSKVVLGNEAKEYSIFSKQCKRYINLNENVILCNINWLNHWYNGNSNLFKYNPNLLWGFYDFYTATITCIQLAMYMGIKEIYLLGVDCNYQGKAKHFYSKEDSKIDESDNVTNSMIRGYIAMKNFADKYGVKIYNATRGGKLEVFPRVEFDEVIKSELKS